MGEATADSRHRPVPPSALDPDPVPALLDAAFIAIGTARVVYRRLDLVATDDALREAILAAEDARSAIFDDLNRSDTANRSTTTRSSGSGCRACASGLGPFGHTCGI
jgi:hypothetical protein